MSSLAGGNDHDDSNAATVRERELELALAKIERMSLPIRQTLPDGRTFECGRVECGALWQASRIAREALRGS